MQYYKRPEHTLADILFDAVSVNVKTRHDRSIPCILIAQDVFVEEDGHLVIKNPSKPYRPAY